MVSFSRTESRYDVATPMCVPRPEKDGARRTLKLTLTTLGSLRGEEETELSNVSDWLIDHPTRARNRLDSLLADAHCWHHGEEDAER